MGSFSRLEDPTEGHIAWILELTYDNLIALSPKGLARLQSGLMLIELAFDSEVETPLAEIDVIDVERKFLIAQTDDDHAHHN